MHSTFPHSHTQPKQHPVQHRVAMPTERGGKKKKRRRGKTKKNSYLLVFGAVLKLFIMSVYMWVTFVSLLLLNAGGECFKFWGKYAFFCPSSSPQPYHVYNSESAAVISRCTERSALSRGSTCSPCGWRRSAAHPTGGGGVPIPSGSVQRRLRSPGWEQYLSQ